MYSCSSTISTSSANCEQRHSNIIRISKSPKKPQRKENIFSISKITKEHCLNSEFLRSFIEVKDKSTFNFDGLINALVSIKRSNTVSAFHYNFLEFKKVLNFKRSQRKTKIDSILKKCKSKFCKVLQEALKKLTNESSLINRLPQSFITNININYNKRYMNKTIKDLYQELGLVRIENDFYCGVDQEKAKQISQFINMTYSQLFLNYITSERFIKDCESIREKEGEKFEILFKYVSKIYIHYYSLSKGNKPKNTLSIQKQL